jgi:hypothetical protein
MDIKTRERVRGLNKEWQARDDFTIMKIYMQGKQKRDIISTPLF